MEFLTDLEKKVDSILQNFELIRQENAQLKGELEKKSGELAKMEEENRELRNNLTTLKTETQLHQDKLKTAAEKIQGLILKIEGV